MVPFAVSRGNNLLARKEAARELRVHEECSEL